MSRVQTKRHFLHQVSGRVEYLTPQWVLDPLGPFDLDPCASSPRPFDIASTNYTERGLEQPWKGLVWLNPPYGVTNQMNKFVEKLSIHRPGGIALLNSNTQTKLWQQTIFPFANAFFFLAGRIHFLNTDGSPTEGHFGSPVLIAFGGKAANRLKKINDYPGYYLENHRAY